MEKIGLLSHPEENMDFEYEDLENEKGTGEGQLEPESATSLPVLCIEDGNAILRFSEIFGIQEPVRKVKTDHHKRPVDKGIVHVATKRSKKHHPPPCMQDIDR
ncbi:Transcription initiation factor TFIID subunit 1 [Zea mays]|uniref:Transcription initiation factor TFIID subunit 1 n=1 Tax=Zea mays TaxID=4577 RepID=A0A1D6P3K6_MAIZE|nr:Transcription initiation factor TFIID subunit 1 [Zea mays]